MASILAFAGSNSSVSINHKLLQFVVSQLRNHETDLRDMSKYNFPMYSVDIEQAEGFSEELVEFHTMIQNADALIISVNEFNGGLSSFFKNVLDWLSRVNRDFLKDKNIWVLATSPGRGGGMDALAAGQAFFERFDANVVATFSLPSFNHTLDAQKGIIDEELNTGFKKALRTFEEVL